ncbi:hypothetical protein A1O3_03712 [Capronia epimyces CBS 606.96]|uniref:3-oxoacyl-[acyl-carrier protein] reductase n=1 Tax=Capronia epimyces CBS 606.96 TaxID=1182542 RepID=W9Y2M4_9EURO|nr:uncharacterized protein A1O3_03712 [Capronia epimyces CBS 606.96]EXJ86758.1 hypothetical protein A1O3_03712 [Capronia epimyces CBS 606.96]
MFEQAHQRFGHLDVVVSNAGINRENLLEDSYDPATGRLQKPDLKNLEVNLVAHVYFVKCAVHYFEKSPPPHTSSPRTHQIVLTGSAASYIDTPPLYQYCAAKTGVLGLMRSLRTQLPRRNITINMIAPWMTVTPMLPAAIKDLWGHLPANTPEGVARALLLPAVDQSINGKAFFIAGNHMVELEDKIHESQPSWMGEKLSEDVDEGQRRLIPVGINPDK